MTLTDRKRIADALEKIGDGFHALSTAFDLMAEREVQGPAAMLDQPPAPAPAPAPVPVAVSPSVAVRVAPPVVVAPAPAPAPKAVEVAPDPSVPRLTQKTPERVALLRRLRVQPGLTNQYILDQLNALPGALIPMKSLTAYFTLWGAPSYERPTHRVAPQPPPPPRAVPTAPAVRDVAKAVGQALGAPVVATRPTIEKWAAERGLLSGKLDLDRVNKKRRDLGLAPFEIEAFQRPVMA